ncbi:MAG TPA: hypothetical protein VFE47_21805 [Tepidisphaeraceae bacterium]|jgi:hypothetical protein|nr:hypothetical protein [Tepidisphaeraceae bacterium]
MPRVLIALLLVAFVCPNIFAADQAPPARAGNAELLLSADETREIDAIIAAMFKAGFPDTAKAVVYSGPVNVTATFDPSKTAPPLPSEASKSQMTIPNSSKVTYSYEFNGLHFKLADGSWILALSYHFTPAKGDAVDAAKAKEIKLATLTADAIAAHPFNAAQAAAQWLEHVAPSQRQRSTQAMDQLVPLTMYLKLGADNLAPAVVLLKGAGFAQADDLCFAIADQRARSFWQLRPWTTPDAEFDPTGAYPNSSAEEAAWHKANPVYLSEQPPVALRRALFRWCRAQLMTPDSEDTLFSPAIAAAATKACVDPNDPQGFAAKIDALAAGMKLPVTPAENADLATKLQSWEARPRTPKMTVSGGNAGLSINTTFAAPVAAYTPDKKDLDGLAGLLADERPSRFADFNGPRTVGDNAWRALAVLLKEDPRKLAGYPVDHPWTTGERRAAAQAVQKWWKTHREEYVGK